MEIKNAIRCRNAIRAVVLLAALGSLQVANAVTVGGLTFIGNDLTSAADLGRMWMRSGLSSPKTYFDYSVKPTFTAAADGALMRGGGSLAVQGGKGFAIDVATKITGAELAAGAGRLLRGTTPLGLLIIGAPLLADYLLRNDMRISGNDLELKNTSQDQSYVYGCSAPGTFYSASSACQAYVDRLNDASFITKYTLGSCGQHSCHVIAHNGSTTGPLSPSDDRDTEFVKYPTGQSETVSWDKIDPSQAQPRLINLPDPNIIPELIPKGATFEPATPSVVTGPSTVPGPTTTSTGSDGKTSTTQQVTNVNYEGNKVTTTNVTSNTVINNDNSTTTTTTTTEAPEQSDLCADHPDILACQKPDLDTPEGDIPKAEKRVTYTEENPFGSGACPANLTASLVTLGESVTVWDWQKTCEYALPLRFLVISLAGFAAFLIVMPGSTHV